MRRIILLVLLAACRREPAKPQQARPPAPPPVTNTAPVPKPLEAKLPKTPETPPIDRDLPAMAAGKTLRVLFTFNSTGYFVYRGETMGYEYDLLNQFAHDNGLRLMPVVVRDSGELFEKLNRGDGDIVAAQLAATANQTNVAMTEGLYETSPVVVQRNAAAPQGSTPSTATAIARAERETTPLPIEVRARLVSTPQELAGQRVTIPRTSPYRTRLIELNNELTQDVDIVEVDESSDRLIQKLAEGAIGYTVTAENFAALKAAEFTNLVIRPAIGPPQPIVWAVRRNAPALLAALNAFVDAKRKAGLLGALYKRYFLDRRGFQSRASSQFLAAETGTLSPYDASFRQAAGIPGWDWRLVAAQAYQESKFNANARSWAGAVGVMQIMPRTARQLRVNPRDPRQCIEGACRYLWQLDDAWKEIGDEEERIKFILGSYNVGTGHVQDAQRLARKHGDDATKWDDVGYWLVRKSQRAVYNDPVVKHGYCRGTEPVAYVDAILARWANYKEFVTP
ncbi:MAG TPA: transporter substrate-binding domain-containing protein [Thermoanaerobaculia bacterium]|nr:transporter substrate-binding domain-containing protein [Thermoanaerobaculia bacterium]